LHPCLAMKSAILNKFRHLENINQQVLAELTIKHFPQNHEAPPEKSLGGVVDATLTCLPVMLAYIPIGFAFGILAVNNGIPPWAAIGMSIFLYAGASQFISIPMIAAGVAAPTIALTTFIVNSRYLLMSTALLPFIKHWSAKRRFLLGWQLTDETFALHSIRGNLTGAAPKASFTINFVAHISWIIATVLGCFANKLITNPEALGVDFALPGMFTAMLMLSLKNVAMVSVALVAAGLFFLLQLTPLREWSLIVAPLIASLLMVVLE
jgi:4-azaleucine resistance transporter AzlC